MARGRKSNKSKYFYFDGAEYLKDVRKAIKEAMARVQDILYEEIRQSMYQLPFKTEAVPMVGKVTSDKERSQALFDSLVKINGAGRFTESPHVSGYIPPTGSYKTHQSRMNVGIEVMGKNYGDSHIGWYYELGTGVYERVIPPAGLYVGDPNRFRKRGQPIVTRGFDKSTDGYWTDMGGNLRRSKGPGGRRTRAFAKRIGADVRQHRWFEESFKTHLPEIKQIIKEAALSVKPHNKKYLHIQTKIKI